jgi:hypothetical protein
MGEAREEAEHAGVVGEDVGAEAVDVPRVGGLEEGVEEDLAEAAPL